MYTKLLRGPHAARDPPIGDPYFISILLKEEVTMFLIIVIQKIRLYLYSKTWLTPKAGTLSAKISRAKTDQKLINTSSRYVYRQTSLEANNLKILPSLVCLTLHLNSTIFACN